MPFANEMSEMQAKDGEQDTSFGLFLGPNYINIEINVVLFRYLLSKTELRNRLLKNISDTIDDNSLFSLNNADLETAEHAVKAELEKLEHNLQMEELGLMCTRLKIRSLDHIMHHHSWLLFVMVSELLAIYISSDYIMRHIYGHHKEIEEVAVLCAEMHSWLLSEMINS